MSDAKFGNLAYAARRRALMALAAGLRVVERAKPVADLFNLFKRVLIGRVGRLVHQPVRLAVKGGRRVGVLREQGERAAEND